MMLRHELGLKSPIFDGLHALGTKIRIVTVISPSNLPEAKKDWIGFTTST